MQMTWSTAEDFVARLMPYLVRVNAGVGVSDDLRERVESPYRVEREKQP
jgi:hypothetical protein